LGIGVVVWAKNLAKMRFLETDAAGIANIQNAKASQARMLASARAKAPGEMVGAR
jgi:hypothetical protein